jgi:protocatechuate 3,4-dioxygenase beta subunit
MVNNRNQDMENDDEPVGRVLSRKEALAVLGAAGAAFLVACTGISQGDTSTTAAPSPTYGPTNAPTEATTIPDTGNVPGCIVRPEMTEGPYFVDEQLDRSDIRVEPSDGSVKEGAPLVLALNVSEVASDRCTPLAGAQVDVWHCDALGVYSGVTDQGEGFNTEGMKFLRGYQVTDESGVARFTTIYPGWYTGRAVHIHFKIRTGAAAEQSYEFTSQLFFDDALTDQVHAQEPYASKGQRDQLNNTDGIFQNGGDQLLLAPAAAENGYNATFAIGLDLSNAETGQTDAMGGGEPGGPGGPPGPP